MNTLLGKKIQQTQGFLENGVRIPVTVVAASDNPVLGIKNYTTYSSLLVGFGKRKKPTKALLGIAQKANLADVPAVIREVRVDEVSVQPGESITVTDVFKPGDIVDVTGQSKGKGFAGGVKRYHFKGGPRTHGQSDRERAPGSIGQTTTPGRVYRGKRMAGNMGDEQVTVKNLVVIDVNEANKTLLLKGLIPGIVGSIVKITKTGEVKEKNFVPLFKLTEPEAAVEETVEEVVTEPEVAAETPEAVVPATEEAQPAETPTEAVAPEASEPAQAEIAPAEEQDVKEETNG